MPLPRAVRPFATGQFRILATALVISMLGTGAWLLAVVFQVRELGGTPSDLSFVAALNGLGILVAVLIGGAVADRVRHKRILVAVEAVKALGFAVAATLGLSGSLEIWHLAIISLVFGVGDGFFFPAYTAMLPSVLPADDLLAANGIEGTLRPTIMQAAGPLLASAIVAATSPGWAFLVVAITQVFAVGALLGLRSIPVRRDLEGEHGDRHPIAAMLLDVGAGFRYMVRTGWLFGTLLFASLLVFLVIGPIEVLLPFAVTDQAGGGELEYAIVLGAFGAGSAIASLVVASFRLPRRYLTVMNLAWGLGCLPLAAVGFTSEVWVMAVSVFVVGAAFGVGSVLWGTLLQRRVPSAMLGRVSSLDWFVSLLFMPISMALAGPIGEAVGFAPTFLVAGVVPGALAIVVLLVFRMGRDELRHPLDDGHDMAGLGIDDLVESGEDAAGRDASGG